MALSRNVPGVAMYKEVTGIVANPSDTFVDPATRSAWFYDGNTFYGGDSVQSIQAKADYIHCNGLAGAMIFSLYDLDPGTTLFNAVVNDVRGEQPDTHSGTYDVWIDKGPCSGGTTSPTPSPTRTTSPTASPTTASPSPTSTGAYRARQAGHAYAVDHRVSYAGHNYRCPQAHTSLPGWEPPNVPALWQFLS